MGGAMSAYFSGKQKFWAGTRTFGAISLALQLASNEMSVLRINLLADQNGGGVKQAHVPITTTSNESSTGIDQRQTAKEDVKQESSLLGKAWTTVASWSPVHRISDEEYEKSLIQRREEVAEQLRLVDQRIMEEEMATHKV